MGWIKDKYLKIRWLLRGKTSIVKMIGGYKRSDGVFLSRTRMGNTTFIDHPQKLYIEDNVYIGHYNYLEASQGMSIHEGVQITNFCNITTHSSHISIRLYGKHYSEFAEHKGYLKGSVEIGSYTFVGPHCTIMPGTRIGKGCIVQAHSFVKGVFPDFSIIGGQPAVVIGDTKEIDRKYLSEDPQLNSFYSEWAD